MPNARHLLEVIHPNQRERFEVDARGLRTSKVVAGSESSAASSANASATATTTHTLYNESRQHLAELNAQGHITRQYIWLVDMLLAVMDSDSGLHPASAADNADGQALAQEVPLSQDLWALVVSWGQVIGSAVTDPSWQLTFIHTNHLGAPAQTFEVNGYFNGLFGANTYSIEDRVVHGAVSGKTQRTMGFGAADAGGNRSMSNADTNKFITYNPRPDNIAQDTRTSNDISQIKNLKNQTGTVNMQQYMSWLREHGYTFAGQGEW